MATSPKYSKYLGDGIVQLIDHAFLEWDDGVVGDVNVLRAHRGAGLGDVAIADAVLVLERPSASAEVQRIHFERGGIDEMSRSDERVEHSMIAQHVAHVLAQEALDALAEFLNAFDVDLPHSPRP